MDQCHRKDIVDGSSEGCNITENEFNQHCDVGKPKNVSVQQKINNEGELNVILRWEKPVSNSKKLFGG